MRPIHRRRIALTLGFCLLPLVGIDRSGAAGVNAAQPSGLRIVPTLPRPITPPIGRLDEVATDGRARGWALDPNASATSIEVHLYVDGRAGQSGVLAAICRADRPRPDVNRATGRPGNHGFDCQLGAQFADRRSHAVYGYGIDVTGDPNALLGGGGAQFRWDSPIGHLEGVGQSLMATGWVVDPSAPAESIDVHFYADGEPGAGGVLVGACRADEPRPDVTQATGYQGAHGFSCRLDAWLRDGQQHLIYAYGIDATGDVNARLVAGVPRPFRASPDDVGICLEPFPFDGDLPPRTLPASRPRIGSDGAIVFTRQDPLSGLTNKMWDIGSTLRVSMVGGTEHMRDRVRHYAGQWTQHANIRFTFVPDGHPAEIRVSFTPNDTNWSLLGRDALVTPFWAPTMNFGSFDDETWEDEYRRHVLHEFGHALGLVHEHQSPVGGIQWDRERVYEFFWTEHGWDRAQVDTQVLNRYAVSTTNYSQYDPMSIMHYEIPAHLTLDRQSVRWNTQLSETDRRYIGMWYPFPPTPDRAVGLLRTGDDCDEIEFTVEYGVLPADQVQLRLDAARPITWWKAIEIVPRQGRSRFVEIQDGQWGAITLNTADIGDEPLRFWKAKFWGFHTRLGYTWDVLRAVPGGTRISLHWRRDKC
jgi:hypothetical protein